MSSHSQLQPLSDSFQGPRFPADAIPYNVLLPSHTTAPARQYPVTCACNFLTSAGLPALAPVRSNVPTRILVGGGNQDLFVQCSTSTWRCVGVRSRSASTRFYAYPIASTNTFALQIPGTTLCLNLWGGGNSGQVNL